MTKVYIYLMMVATLFATLSCSTDVEHEITQVASPVLVSSTPASDAAGVELGEITISLTYDKKCVFCISKQRFVIYLK